MVNRRFALFDFDGVIADSYAIALETGKRMCPRMTEEAYRTAFEGNVHDNHTVLMAEEHGPGCNHELDWFDLFVPAFEERATLFGGMREVIEQLSHAYVLIVVSSTITSPIQGFLEKHHIGRYFSEVMGADVHTSKHEKIQMIFNKYDAQARECVFITDTLGDMREAKKADVGSIGVTWGFHPRTTLEKGAPYAILDAPEDVPATIGEYFRNQIHSSPKKGLVY